MPVYSTLPASPAWAQAGAPPDATPVHSVEGIHEHRLANGLRVILYPDASKPTVTVNITYLVGSRHENHGETGMAHLLEHLIFKGSPRHPNPDAEFTRRGFRNNGTTGFDRTNYFSTFQASDDNLRWALDWSADAMVNAFISRKDLDSEMTVVRNEFEAGESAPGQVLFKRLFGMMFDAHAYARLPIGNRSDIENVRIENLQAFYRTYYQPDNAVLTVAGQQGTLVVRRTTAANGFDDVAQAEALMNEQGVPMEDRVLALSTRDYNGMAGNLANGGTASAPGSRSFGNSVSDQALRNGLVGRVASFETYKLDYAQRKAAAAGGAGLTINTLAGGGNYFTPKATTTAVTGETSNVDNRFQTVTVSSTTNVAVGDSFTIANCNNVHMITKEDTGQPKTFRVIAVPSATTLVISPPIIPAQAAVDSTLQYQNCKFTATSGTAGITFLNSAAAYLNCFWHRDSMEILPGRYAVPSDAGVAVMRASTDQGVELVMTKQYDINTMKTKYRLDTLFGVVCKQPEMAGIMIFSQ